MRYVDHKDHTLIFLGNNTHPITLDKQMQSSLLQANVLADLNSFKYLNTIFETQHFKVKKVSRVYNN